MREIFVRQVTVIDYAVLDGDAGLIGESDIVDVALKGELNDESMIFDFGLIKRQIKTVLDEQIDHRLLVPVSHPNLVCTEHSGQREVIQHLGDDEILKYSAPACAVAWFPTTEITRSFLAQHCAELIQATLPDNVTRVKVNLRREPTEKEGTPLTYSHGLRDHQGNCQRLVHGHLSRLRIDIDGNRATELEERWATLLGDRYIGSQPDCVSTFTMAEREFLQFWYRTAQGPFFLEIPADRCYLIDSRTTVEMIAEHLLAQISLDNPTRHVSVTLDEGLGKGVRVATNTTTIPTTERDTNEKKNNKTKKQCESRIRDRSALFAIAWAHWVSVGNRPCAP